MFSVRVFDNGKRLRLSICSLAFSEKTLLSFRSERSGRDFLTLLHFAEDLGPDEALFEAAEKRLPRRLCCLLLYFYASECGREKMSAEKELLFRRELEHSLAEGKNQLQRAVEEKSALPLQLKLHPVSGVMTAEEHCFLLYTLEDFCHLQLFYLLPEIRQIRSCEVCKAWFIPLPRQKGELCKYKKKSKKSCTELRCRKNAEESLRNDPLLSEYRRVYKRQYMRCERALDMMDNGVLSPGNFAPFRQWSARARAGRKAYRAGQIGAEEFAVLLAAWEKEILYSSLDFSGAAK